MIRAKPFSEGEKCLGSRLPTGAGALTYAILACNRQSANPSGRFAATLWKTR